MEQKQSTVKFFFQYLFSPILIVLLGALLNFQIEKTRNQLQRRELEIKRINAAQSMIKELFSGTPERAFIAERLITKIVDEDMGKEITEIIKTYYSSRIGNEIDDNNLENIKKLKYAAENVKSTSSIILLNEINKSKFHIVIASITNKEEAIKLAQGLHNKNYQSEVHYSPNGYYAVTIGSFSLEEAEKNKKQAMRDGTAPKDSWLSQGKSWTEKVYP